LFLGNKKAYSLLADLNMQQLALDPLLYRHLSSKWVLYPDHAVFLGPSAVCYKNIDDFLQQVDGPVESYPRIIFISNVGVYVTSDFNSADFAQLRCYFDVLCRQFEDAPLKSLLVEDISALLNWDAEKYRMSLKNN
jgi:rhamnose utilization protein RhaD (predicted bifunctional aldolase and dehydrogenase)